MPDEQRYLRRLKKEQLREKKGKENKERKL